MVVRALVGFAIIVSLFLLVLYAAGKGWLGQPFSSEPVAAGPSVRPADVGPGDSSAVLAEPQILFGDLHTHTNHSFDAYVFNTALVKGGGVVTPADACDFARYCSALDFWSINDHAEGLTPRAWSDTVSTIRSCNRQAGDFSNPDMVSFLGWEWTNDAGPDAANHYGHKNVIFRTWEEGQTPARPIAARDKNRFTQVPPLLLGVAGLLEGLFDISDLGWYMEESRNTPLCDAGMDTTQLPRDCLEVARTPTELFRKLDEWGLDSLVIPHGLAWGNTNPLNADFRSQLDEHEERYQKLLEVYSGHGSAEYFEDFNRSRTSSSNELACPESTENFRPCCQQAGRIAQRRCAEPGSAECEFEVQAAVKEFLALGAARGRTLFEDTPPEDWDGCGQLQNAFQPSARYVPKQSAQYNLALGFDDKDQPRRARLGLIGSSDGHQARPGSSYKEDNRLLYTDHKDLGRRYIRSDLFKPDRESSGFYYTGGLIAAHANGRNRDAIWDALDSRNVYATSGDRTLVWFDLINGPEGTHPMGSEVSMNHPPRFRVTALGAFKQLPGCPDHAMAGLGQARVQSLCGGECYQPADQRKGITRIEIVRIRPQIDPVEPIASLVENTWKVFECPADGSGCTVEFDDADYPRYQRSSLYYARVIQEAELLIVGDPFGCEYDGQGECVKRNYCIGKNAKPEMNCQSEAEPRAWTSPIFLEFLREPSR